MIDTKKAKVRFLSLAFRGKLEDYPQKEKKNDNLDDIHKTQNNYQAVSESEQLIDVPAHWNWSRLGYVTSNHGQTVPDKDFCYIDVGTLDNVHQRLSEAENLVTAKDAPSRARKIVHLGDVLYSTVRPYLHNICIVDREFSRTPIASTAFCVMQVKDNVLLNKYLFYWLLTAEFDSYANGDPSKGALYPAIGEKDLLHGVIPLPPVKEQSVIVDRIEKAFSALETIDALQAHYADNLTSLKSKLIDAAIQGKLTEQLPEDGTAEELYQQIQEEKQALIKAGKVKKEKPLPEINDENLPFEIPSNWKWTRIGEIFTLQSGKNIPTGSIQDKPDNTNIYPCYGGNGLRGYTDHFNVKGYHAIIGRQGALCGNINFAGDEFYATEHAVVVYAYANTNMAWAGMTLRALNLNQYATSVAQPGLAVNKITDVLIPLPPLAEQRRIVEKLDEVLNCIETAQPKS